MRKRAAMLFLVCMLAVSGTFVGCSNKNAEKAQEYKELGIKQLNDASYEDAAESFQKALDESIGKVGAQELDVCYYKALAQFKGGDIKGAVETYDGLIKYDKKNWEAYYLRGSAYLQDGNVQECLKDYSEAVSLNEKDLELYAHIYENLTAAGKEDEGETYLREALSLKLSSAEDYANAGYIYFLKGDYDNAEKNLKEAVDKKSDEALLRLGQVYAAENKNDEARESFEKYMEKYPDDADALNELGEMAMRAQEYADAVTYFEKAADVSAKEDLQEIRRNLIAACEYAGEYDKALDAAKDYMEDYPKDETMQKEYEFLKTRVSKKKKKVKKSDESAQAADSSPEETDS